MKNSVMSISSVLEQESLNLLFQTSGCPWDLSSGSYIPPNILTHSQPGTSSSKDPTVDFGHYATLDINITHPIRMTQLAISHFLSPPSSTSASKVSLENPKRILHIASTASEIASLPYPMYVASKWAISGFVRSLADLEGKLGIR